MMWQSLPFRWVLRGQKTKPGEVNLLIDTDKDSYAHAIHDVMKTLCMGSFHMLIIWRTSNNLSWNGGVTVTVNLREKQVFQKQRPDKYWFICIGNPLNIIYRGLTKIIHTVCAMVHCYQQKNGTFPWESTRFTRYQLHHNRWCDNHCPSDGS